MPELTPRTRVRFAPSPTGYFHVGGARTALFNWLFARQRDGTFVLRIEDTDRERSAEDWIGGILDALRWLGLDWDEGPFRQSERRPLYEDAVARLIAAGRVYACDCTREAIVSRAVEGSPPGYDGHCRELGLPTGEGRALRFRVPGEGTTVVHDLIRGDVVFANSTIEDFVVVKSNGDPLFVLAVVVDDQEMAITDVIRAEEHLPTTPKAVLLWEALAGPSGPSLPRFAHVPVLVNEKRQKLSKRRDQVAVEDYRAKGYLPEAMRNYLALLGWSPSDGREILSLEELIDEFRLEDVNHSPAFFDERKLLHFNGTYLRAMPTAAFIEASAPFVVDAARSWSASAGVAATSSSSSSSSSESGGFDRGVFERLAPLAQERVGTLDEVPAMVEFAFVEPSPIDEASFAKAIEGDDVALAILEEARAGFEVCPWSAADLKPVVEAIGERHGRKLAKAQAPIRVAVLGRTVGLPLFESLVVLGRPRTLERLAAAIVRAQREAAPAG